MSNPLTSNFKFLSNFVERHNKLVTFELLGQAAGNFVLATGSFDGLFVAGGIVQRYPDLLRNSAFRTGFENKGRHRELMRAVPTVLVDHPLPGLLGVFAAAKSWY